MVRRRRKVDPSAMAWTVALGFGTGRERTRAGLRRRYRRATGTSSAPSAFYDRFTPEPVRFGSPRQLVAVFRRRISWDDGAIRERAGAVAFRMNRCCRIGEAVGARAPSVGKRWGSEASPWLVHTARRAALGPQDASTSRALGVARVAAVVSAPLGTSEELARAGRPTPPGHGRLQLRYQTGLTGEQYVERVEHQVGAKRVRHPPAHDAPDIGVDDEREVDEPRPGRNVGEVREPRCVRARGLELPADPVRGARERR